MLDGLPTIKAAIEYCLPDGRELTTFPDDLHILIKAEPIYKSFPAKDYIEFIENFSDVKIGSIGCGPARDNLIFRL